MPTTNYIRVSVGRYRRDRPRREDHQYFFFDDADQDSVSRALELYASEMERAKRSGAFAYACVWSRKQWPGLMKDLPLVGEGPVSPRVRAYRQS